MSGLRRSAETLMAAVLAAGDDLHGEPRVAADVHEVGMNLPRQLAGGHQDQHPWAVMDGPLVEQVLHDRQQERNGLAGAGGGGHQQLQPLHRRRDHLLLHRGWGVEAGLGETAQQRLGEFQLVEGGRVGFRGHGGSGVVPVSSSPKEDARRLG